MQYQAFFLDFDGTIVDSALIKLEAFKNLYAAEKHKIGEIYTYLLSEQGRPRYEKFKFIQESILGKRYKNDLGEELSKKLDAEISETGIPSLMPGVIEFLQESQDEEFVGIVSAAPRREIINTLHHHNIVKYFDFICGSEITKSSAIRKCISEFQLSPDDSVMIGDSANDYKASVEAGIHFIGFRYGENANNPRIFAITDFYELMRCRG